VKKALMTIFAAAALVMLVVPAADAMLGRSLPTTYSQAKAAKVAKKATKAQKAKHAVRAASIYVPPVVVCPEPDPGDSWGYCIAVTPQSDAGTSSIASPVTSVTSNDGAGT
jgi:hypothetical protein